MRRARYWALAPAVVLALFALTPGVHVNADDADGVTYATIDPPGAIYSEANDINSRGEIVGRFYDGNTCNVTNACFIADGHNHGFLLSDGEFTTIEPLGSTLTGAVGISPDGIVVGTYRTADGIFHGFTWSAGEFTTIDFPGATFTRLQGINSRGDIVGEYHLPLPPPQDAPHGFLLRGDEFSPIDFPGALRTSAWKINSHGQIAGRYQNLDLKSHVFLLSDGEFTTIDFPGSFNSLANALVGLNTRGDIASHYCEAAPCTIASNRNIHAFLRSGGEFTSFDFPNSYLTVAFGINNRGDIVGVYKDRSTTTCTISPACAQGHAFLRTMREGGKPRNDAFFQR